MALLAMGFSREWRAHVPQGEHVLPGWEDSVDAGLWVQARLIDPEDLKVTVYMGAALLGQAPAHEVSDAANWALEWVGMLPGKRENRRYVGDHILTQNDVRRGEGGAGGRFADKLGEIRDVAAQLWPAIKKTAQRV